MAHRLSTCGEELGERRLVWEKEQAPGLFSNWSLLFPYLSTTTRGRKITELRPHRSQWGSSLGQLQTKQVA